MNAVTDLLAWTPWVPLVSAPTDRMIPRSPGLYRIRRVGRTDVDYIGQTGMRLGQRLAMLRGVHAEQMPYRDPHTAAPALWALRHATGCDFEISVTPMAGPTPWRKGFEALAISLYRQQHQQSPTVEFGRMPSGYRASSGNNARLVRRGKRFRGGPAHELILDSHSSSVPPIGPFGDQPQASDWCGHAWSDWMSLAVGMRLVPDGVGLYRIRGDTPRTLLYVGQGSIPARPLAHLAKPREPGHNQARILAAQTRLECSWVSNDLWLFHHRLELANDLIAAHLLRTGEIPAAQFVG